MYKVCLPASLKPQPSDNRSLLWCGVVLSCRTVVWVYVVCFHEPLEVIKARPGPCDDHSWLAWNAAATGAALRVSPPDSESTVGSYSLSPKGASSCEEFLHSKKHTREESDEEHGGVQEQGCQARRAKRLCCQRSSSNVLLSQHMNNRTGTENVVVVAHVRNSPPIGGGSATDEWGHEVQSSCEFLSSPDSPTRGSCSVGDMKRCCPWNEPGMEQSREKLLQMKNQLSSMNLDHVRECIGVTRRANSARAERSTVSRPCFHLHNKLWPGRVMGDLAAKQRCIYELQASVCQNVLSRQAGKVPSRKLSHGACLVDMKQKHRPAGMALISGLGGLGFMSKCKSRTDAGHA